jgi:MFS transporter, DHA3 family, macrolide efflux protein
MKDFLTFFTKDTRVFLIIWFGQLISGVGSAMTNFALIIWAYQITGKAGTLAMLGFYSCISFVLTSLIAGPLVDRWNRRMLMIVTDFGAGLMTALLLVLLLLGKLEIRHLYLVQAVSGVFRAFQSPAYFASVTLLVPSHQLTRVNGMNSFSNYASSALAPIFAGLVLQWTSINVIFIIDILPMLAAVISLLMVPIPQPKDQVNIRLGSLKALIKEAGFGMQYIARRPGLLGMMSIHFFINLFGTISYFSVLSPMILARSGGDTLALSAVQTVMGIGGVVGAFLVSLWGGSKNRVRMYMASTAISFFVCDFLFAVGKTLPVWLIAGAFSTLTIPFMTSPYYAIWQLKVPASVQGRVFSVRDVFQIGSQPIGFLLGGFLADSVFEPAMAAGSGWIRAASGLVGSGPGAGMAAMFLFTCIFGTITGLAGFFIPKIRNVEKDIPDCTDDAQVGGVEALSY